MQEHNFSTTYSLLIGFQFVTYIVGCIVCFLQLVFTEGL